MTDSSIITRFNPTANGLLHIGHLYTALVNRGMAKSNKYGKFIIRIEDDNQHIIDKYPADKRWGWVECMITDMDWAGLIPDQLYCQSNREREIQEFMGEAGINPPRQPRRSQHFPLTPQNDTLFYSYVPYFTFKKVILDYLDSVTYLIRGMDLMSEFSLYDWFCEVLNLPIPEQYYLPRLAVAQNNDLNQISKTVGGYTLASFRENGVDCDELEFRLSKSCLIDITKPWTIDNIKTQPVYDASLWKK